MCDVQQTADLSSYRCDLSTTACPGEAARKFYCWLCELAEAIGADHPQIYPPNSRRESGDCWWVVWEDCPWEQWAITGGAWTTGNLAGWETLRSGAAHRHPETGPLIRQLPRDTDSWYLETYWGFDFIFQA